MQTCDIISNTFQTKVEAKIQKELVLVGIVEIKKQWSLSIIKSQSDVHTETCTLIISCSEIIAK